MIRIQNIYYLLSYAFQILKEQGYRKIAAENFENTAELFAEILIRGVSSLLKRGLGKDYREQSETTSSLRGKIDLSESLRQQTFIQRQMVCHYDEFSTDTYFNQIIKTTMLLLLEADVTKERKRSLRRLLQYFEGVKTLQLKSIQWNIWYNRNNQIYRMLIGICYLTVKGLLQTNKDGTVQVMDFLDEQQMHRLYEKFILEYYRKEFPMISARAAQIPWVLDDDVDDLLPVMQSDITLEYKKKILIIDAKYYSHILTGRFGSSTVNSANLYQIFTYVKNESASIDAAGCKVSGMLLYARTDEENYPEKEYRMSGSRIAVRTLNLDSKFSEIREELNEIAERYLELDIVLNK